MRQKGSRLQRARKRFSPVSLPARRGSTKQCLAPWACRYCQTVLVSSETIKLFSHVSQPSLRPRRLLAPQRIASVNRHDGPCRSADGHARAVPALASEDGGCRSMPRRMPIESLDCRQPLLGIPCNTSPARRQGHVDSAAVTVDACAAAIHGDESVACPCKSMRHMRTSRGLIIGRQIDCKMVTTARPDVPCQAGSEVPRRRAMRGKGRCAAPGSAVRLDRPGPWWLKLATACSVLAKGRLLPRLVQTRQSAQREVRPTLKEFLALAARIQASTSPQVIEASPARSAGRLRCFLP